jgi:hypothetical protein
MVIAAANRGMALAQAQRPIIAGNDARCGDPCIAV